MNQYLHMRNRRFLHVEKPGSEEHPASTGQMSAMTSLSSVKDKSPMAPYYALTGPGETECVAAQLQTVFDDLYRKFERLCVETSARPSHHRSVAITWVETAELPLEINAIICATRESSSSSPGKSSQAVFK